MEKLSMAARILLDLSVELHKDGEQLLSGYVDEFIKGISYASLDVSKLVHSGTLPGRHQRFIRNREMIDEELIKRHEEAVQDVNEKIGYLDSCINDLKDSLRKFWDVENKFPAEALNELLKMGLLPGTIIEVNLNKNRFRLNGYTATDCSDFSPVPDEKGDTHIYYNLFRLYRSRDNWHIVKEGE